MDAGRFKQLTRPGAVQRLLVRATNWLGDAVMMAPALAALRQRFPDARISLLAKPAVGELFKGHPAIDEIIWYRSPGPHAGWGGKWSLSRTLSQARFDLAILFQNAFEAALITALAGIPNRYGYVTDGRRLLLTHPVPRAKGLHRRHQVAYYLELLHPLGVAVEATAPVLYTTADEDAAAMARLNDLQIDTERPIIGLNPGSSYGSAKRWLPQRFAEVADRLIASSGGHVLIFGGPGEWALGEAIAERISSPNVSVLSGRTSVRQLMALIKRCKLFVTNDCGPMHIAAAFDVPLVAVFGPTDPVTTAPFGSGHELVRHPVDCSPCLLRECPIDHRCMRGLSVDIVSQAALRLLPLPAGKERAEPCQFARDETASGNDGMQAATDSAPVVFLDRDGTINVDPGYLNDPEAVRLLPGVGPAMARLNRAGFKTVVVTNQSGIGRGLIREEVLDAVHQRMRQLLAESGAWLDGIYFCPHLPEDLCGYRKPSAGLVDRARQELKLSSDRAFVIGDKATDVALARNIGASAVFVLSGDHPDEQRSSMEARGLVPDYVAKDLDDAVRWILEKENAIVLE